MPDSSMRSFIMSFADLIRRRNQAFIKVVNSLPLLSVKPNVLRISSLSGQKRGWIKVSVKSLFINSFINFGLSLKEITSKPNCFRFSILCLPILVIPSGSLFARSALNPSLSLAYKD